MKIGAHVIGEGRCWIVAEAALEHGGNIDRAFSLIDAAADAGADAVKFQTFMASELGAPALERYELHDSVWPYLKRRADARGITFFSTPFDCESVDLLDPLVPCFKIASGEITNERLLRHVASKGKPVILSTGMATEDEVGLASKHLASAWYQTVLLHCVSAYPAPPDEMNLRALARLFYSWPSIQAVGLSDHTLGWEIPVAAVAMGAGVIEKHLTLPDVGGPDHAMSLKPDEFAAMVRAIRLVESAMGDGWKRVMPSEVETRARARRDPATGKRP